MRDVDDLANANAEFVDENSLLVQRADGTNAILDTSTGETSSVPPGQIFWCTGGTTFKVNEDKTFNKAENRPVGYEFYPCKENGDRAQSWPSTSPQRFGITVDGEFMWAIEHGLARRSVGPAQWVA